MTAAAVILFVSAGLGLLLCVGLTAIAGEASDDEQAFVMIFAVVLVAVSVLNAVLGYFILRGVQWARITAIVLAMLGAGIAVLNLLLSAGQGSPVVGNCLGIVVNLMVAGLLSGERASDYFRHQRIGGFHQVTGPDRDWP